MKNFAIVVLFALCSLFTIGATAQIQTPAASPTEKTEITVGLTDVHITYSRPSMKGRTIFSADGLVPYGKIWRTGANAATKIEFSDDVKLGGTDVKAGAYAILTKPMAVEWEVMLFPYEGGSWGSYLEKEPVATVSADVAEFPTNVETFTISVGNISKEGANIYMMWENTMVALPLEVSFDERVEAAIAKVMAGPSSRDYYLAASYYHDNDKDLDQALEWIQMANKDPRYWQLRSEAMIHASMGNYVAAIADAKSSSEMASEAGNDGYVRMNDKSIKEWTAKMGKGGMKKAKAKTMKTEKMK